MKAVLSFSLLWIARLTCWIWAPVLAFLVCLLMVPSSFVRDAISDFAFRYPKWLKCLFWTTWYRGSFYFNWKRPSGGHGPARWFWRKPKGSRWVASSDWWVFRG